VKVEPAQHEDFDSWLALAAEVEPLFGPMVGEPGFLAALRRNIERGSAFCLRQADGGPGAPLRGGLLFSPKPPVYHIGWLSVASRCRRRGVGTALVLHAMNLVCPPAELRVKTFGPDVPAGEPARRFYGALGFAAAETSDSESEGGARQIFRLVFNSRSAQQQSIGNLLIKEETS
jgi:ribosomal protein S18 acetylase RimI-like enzyme